MQCVDPFSGNYYACPGGTRCMPIQLGGGFTSYYGQPIEGYTDYGSSPPPVNVIPASMMPSPPPAVVMPPPPPPAVVMPPSPPPPPVAPVIQKPKKCNPKQKLYCPANYVCDTQKGYCVPSTALETVAKATVPANLVPANIAYTMPPSQLDFVKQPATFPTQPNSISQSRSQFANNYPAQAVLLGAYSGDVQALR